MPIYNKFGSSKVIPEGVYVDSDKTDIRVVERDFDDDKEIWEMQSWEKQNHFQWFRAYRRLGGSRTLGKVSKISDVKPGTIYKISIRNYWVYRTDQWDRYSDHVERMREISGIKLMKKRHINLTKEMLELIAQKLKTMTPEEIVARDVPRWIETGMKLERLSRNVDQVLEQGNNSASDDLMEKDRLITEIREKVSRLTGGSEEGEGVVGDGT